MFYVYEIVDYFDIGDNDIECNLICSFDNLNDAKSRAKEFTQKIKINVNITPYYHKCVIVENITNLKKVLHADWIYEENLLKY